MVGHMDGQVDQLQDFGIVPVYSVSFTHSFIAFPNNTIGMHLTTSFIVIVLHGEKV